MKSAEPSDDELIKGCRENNRKCQEMLYRRYARSMFNLCLVYENDRDSAKDILQEGFIKIFSGITGFNRKNSLAGWMKKIITNTAIDYYRKNHHHNEFIQVDSIDKVCPDDDSPALLINTEDIIKQVNKLPPGAKKIFQLHAIEGYSHREISKLLHISVGTSKSQINRAKQLLQHWIAGNQI